ncbi:MAG TPA: hypothetical protein VFQ86_12145, partial [Arachidicoccus soli]|nr:hypothetical protein [Arachidicoccus soli]
MIQSYLNISSIVRSKLIKSLVCISAFLLFVLIGKGQSYGRQDILIDTGWHTIADSFNINA